MSPRLQRDICFLLQRSKSWGKPCSKRQMMMAHNSKGLPSRRRDASRSAVPSRLRKEASDGKKAMDDGWRGNKVQSKGQLGKGRGSRREHRRLPIWSRVSLWDASDACSWGAVTQKDGYTGVAPGRTDGDREKPMCCSHLHSQPLGLGKSS